MYKKETTLQEEQPTLRLAHRDSEKARQWRGEYGKTRDLAQAVQGGVPPPQPLTLQR